MLPLFVLLLAVVSSASAQALTETFGPALNQGWLVVGGALVFVMQAGFTMLEVGSVRVKNTKSVLLKNIMDNCYSGVAFWATGYAFSFGKCAEDQDNDQPFIGYCNFALHDLPERLFAYFFFQWGFASATATIVSGAIAERTSFIAYTTNTLFLTGFVYPVIAHWAWASDGWLKNMFEIGYLDFAGSGVVHLTGGIAALVGAFLVGPRLNRFVDGKAQDIAGFSTTLITIGVFFLWFGWYGFNPVSTLTLLDGGADLAAKVAINTTLSAATGGLTLLAFERIVSKTFNPIMSLNGILAGLVSITAGCGYVDFWATIPIGLVGAFVYYGMSKLLVLAQIDDVVDAAPVHAGCGFWGVLALSFFAHRSTVEWAIGKNSDSYGLFYGGNHKILVTQITGIAVIIGWSAFWTSIVFGIFKVTGFLRSSHEEEAKVAGDNKPKNSWARVEIMDNGRIDEFQFAIK